MRAELGLGPRGRERRRSEPEVAVAGGLETRREPFGALLGAAVLGEPPCELLGRDLGLELGELGVLLGEERSRLELEQRGDEHEELAARVEVEPAALVQVLEKRDHDLGEVDLAQRELVAEDERQQQVERPLERVEVEVELADGEGFPLIRGRLAPLPDAAFRARPSAAAPGRAVVSV